MLVAFIIFTTGSSLAFAAGEYSFVKSWGSQGLTKTGSFTYPQYAAVDDTGNVYVTDLGNTRVQKFSNDGTFLHAWGIKGTRPGEFHAPAGIAVGGNSVYVVDHELHAVKKFDTNGKFIKAWGSEGTDAGKLKLPNGVAVSKDNYVYVVDTGNSRVQKFDSEGQFVSIIGSSGTGDGQLLTPLGIAVDSDGSIYVGDYGNKRIQKFASNGSFLKSFTSSAGGLKIAPDGVTVDMSGNIILADTTNNRIVVLDKDGNTKTAFGTTGTGNIQFKMPKDVVSEADGDLFVVDSSNHRIQKFGPGQTQTTQTQTTQTQTTQNTVQVKQTGTDLKKPIIVPPKDIYVEATGGLTVVSIGQAVANDDSGIQSLTNNAPQQFPLGITTVIWTAIDNAGNVGIATQTVTVGDSTPPVISGLSDITMEANSVQNTVELGNPKVTDQVGVMTVENDAPSTFALGETVVTWTAIDVAKNVETLSQKVTIIDTKPPKIRAPAAVTVEATSIDGNSVTLGEPSVTDNSEISSITNDAPTLFPIGETVVTWTAVDVAGNVADATQKVIVTDTAAPSIAQPAEIIVEAVSSKENPVELSAPTVTDIQQTTITNDAPQ
ncbi:MAG: 6-bladed beta-propeller, partial [Candidatus Nitrosotenuis sp.]|nr:6-bladed beta-propeller [Candidatus Nitrosotenuis sp.]